MMAGRVYETKPLSKSRNVNWAPVIASCIGLCATSPAFAQKFDTDVGASERVGYAGELGAVTQHLVAAACNLNAGIAVEASQENLNDSITYFEDIINALTNGDEELGVIGEEKRARTLTAINDLNQKWAPLRDVAVNTVANAGNQEQIASLASQSNAILEAAFVLQGEVSGQYADPVSLSQADAVLIEIAGRQRLFAERMSKDLCLISSDVVAETASEELTTTIDIFDLSLNGLQKGVPEMGVSGPPTPEIEEGLANVAAKWAALMPVLKSVATGESLDMGARAAAYTDLLVLERDLDEIVHQYSENSKLNL